MPVKPPPPRYARHPFEVCIVISFIFSCLSLVLFGPSSTSDLDPSTQAILSVAILFGSVLVLAGAYWKEIIMAAFFELGGLIAMGGFIAAWILGVAVQIHNWSSGLGTASLIAIFSACAWRATQIIKWIHWVYKDHPPEFWEGRQAMSAMRRQDPDSTNPAVGVARTPTEDAPPKASDANGPINPPITWREPEGGG